MTSDGEEMLTRPNDRASIHSRENRYGDLLVCRNDVISAENGDEFRVLDILGCGQFGQVFKVVKYVGGVDTEELFALKISKKQQDKVDLALAEVEILKKIQTKPENEAIGKFISYFMYYGHVCIVQELLYLNLYEVIKKRSYRGLPLEIVQSVGRQLLSALVTLRECEIIHSDIKPENILLADGVSTSVKLIDFGSARCIHQKWSNYVQSRYYRAPEVVLNMYNDYKIDIWSVACVLFELYVGMPLFPGQSEIHLLVLISEMLGGIPESVRLRSNRAQFFFDADGRMLPEAEICRRVHRPTVTFSPYFVYNNIEDIIMNFNPIGTRNSSAMAFDKRNRRLFIDFLIRCLDIEPNTRPSAEEASHLPFITQDLADL